MAEPKTQPTDVPAAVYLYAIPDAQMRQDCWKVTEIMQRIAGEPPRMWGSAIVGFGEYLQKYANGKTSPWPLIAFSARKQAITLYLYLTGVEGTDALLKKLGKHSLSKACLYIKRLSDVDVPTLTELIRLSHAHMTGP